MKILICLLLVALIGIAGFACLYVLNNKQAKEGQQESDNRVVNPTNEPDRVKVLETERQKHNVADLKKLAAELDKIAAENVKGPPEIHEVCFYYNGKGGWSVGSLVHGSGTFLQWKGFILKENQLPWDPRAAFGSGWPTVLSAMNKVKIIDVDGPLVYREVDDSMVPGFYDRDASIFYEFKGKELPKSEALEAIKILPFGKRKFAICGADMPSYLVEQPELWKRLK